jgi:hypothetical protein
MLTIHGGTTPGIGMAWHISIGSAILGLIIGI